MAEQNQVKTETVKIDEMVIDPRAQARVNMDQNVIDEYAEAMQAGAAIPTIEGVRVTDSEHAGKVVIWDGFHRVAAARKCGVTEIPVDVREGTLADAIDLCTGANTAHGLRRTNEDKRHAVLMAIALDKQLKRKRSDRMVAAHVGVHNSTVSEIRAELSGKSKKTKKRDQDETTREPVTETTEQTGEVAGVQVDELGRPVKDNTIKAVLALCPEFDEVIRQIESAAHRVLGLAETVAGDELRPKLQNIKFDLEGAKNTVKYARPFTSCPYGPNCAAECSACRGRNWVSKETWDRTPENIRNQAISGISEVQVSESDTQSTEAQVDDIPAEVVAH